MERTNNLTPDQTTHFLSTWPRYFATGALLCTSVFFFTESAQWFAVSFTFLYIIFLFDGRPFWLIYGKTGGWANSITAARILGILLLVFFQAALHPYVFLVFGILILVADGLDGYFARKYNTVSDFGDFFDKETDAFFVLAFCVILMKQELLGAWVLLPGLLRYAFVLILYVCRIEHIVLQKSKRRAFVGMWFMGTIMGCFVFPEPLYTATMIFATAMLAYSFMKDLFLMLRVNYHQG